MNDKTLGEYKRTTPDPDETTGEALARLQATLTRLLDEADAELRDEADGGVAAALIEQEAEQQTAEVRELRSALAREIARGNALQDALDATESRPLTPDAITDEMVDRAMDVYIHAEGSPRDAWRAGLAAALTEPPARPEWLDAPAVRAWHKSDGRTERDGTPGKPRIWSPDYGTTETWSTPSLREVPWTDLVDVEPLDVSADLAEGLDRVAEFMRTGGVRVVGEEDPR